MQLIKWQTPLKTCPGSAKCSLKIMEADDLLDYRTQKFLCQYFVARQAWPLIQTAVDTY